MKQTRSLPGKPPSRLRPQQAAVGLLVTGGLLVAIAPDARANPDPVSLNFNELDAAVGMSPENIEKLLLGYGIELSTENRHHNPLNIFDTNCKAHSCEFDPDLQTGSDFGSKKRRNVLIVQEENNGQYRSVSDPDDMIGSSIFFDFVETDDTVGFVEDLRYFEMLDLDGAEQVTFKFWYEGESESTDWVSANKVKWMQGIDPDTNREVWDSADNSGDNSLSRYFFDHGDKRISKAGVKMTGSGAVSKLKYIPVPPPPDDEVAEVPEPATALGLVAVGALFKTVRRRKLA
ncbi:MAG: PEP-CTERM sorting domain-containing protein [Geitlerinemataceae cyanobacterium]